MKYSASVVALVVASNSLLSADGFNTVSSRSSFVPRASFGLPATTTAASSSSVPTQMLVQGSGGMLELEEWLDADSGVTKTVRKSPGLWKAAKYAAIPASAALGFGLVPSTKIAASAAGAAASTIAGIIGRNKMGDVSSHAAKPAIAALLIEEGIDEPTETAKKLAELKDEFAVNPDDFDALCQEVYRKYLVGMVKFDGKPRSSELTELENLKEALMLDNLAVGEAHMLAAQDWFREACLFVPEEDLEDEDNPERICMNKFLYLTERALKQNGETDGAFLYEMTRTAKVFNLTYYEALDRVEEVLEPFYERALKSARGKLGTNQVSATMLERARSTLGVDPAMGFDLHEAALSDEVRSLLGKTDDADGVFDPKTAKFPEGTLERLEQLREYLSLSQEDVEYEITSEAMPLFRATALDAMKDAVSGDISAEEAWKIMDTRREDLLIPADKSDELVSTVVVNALGAPLEEVKMYADVENEGAAYDEMMEVLKSKAVVEEVLKFAGWKEDFYESFCNPLSRDSIINLFEKQERMNLYDMMLKRAIKNSDEGKLTDEIDAKLKEVRDFLSIDEVAAEGQMTKQFGPKLFNAMEKAMNEIIDDYTPALLETLSEEVQTIVDDYKISDKMISQHGRSLYNTALQKVKMMAPGGVPSKKQNEALEALRTLCRMDTRETTPMHLTAFGSVYTKSLEEAMAITGIISAEYRQPLEDLRDRLGVSEREARELFLEAVKKRMIPMVEWIVSEMERTVFTQQQLAQRRDKDMGEDLFQSGKKADGTLGLGAEVNVLGDIMNLVDFYNENEIAEKKQIDTKKIEKVVEEDGNKKTVEVEVPVYESIYPITALETGAIDDQMAEYVYRQFVVGSFTTQGPNAARYEASRETLGGIIGLEKPKMDEISSNIAESVYDNYVGQSMRTKGALDQQDMMTLANLQGKLGITADQSEALMTTAQKKILIEEMDATMMSPTPDTVKAFREKCNSMALNLQTDLGISKGRLTRMFEVEVSPGLDSGELTTESGEFLSEIQESLGFSEEDAEKALENIILQKSKRDFDKVAKDARRGRFKEMVDPVKRLVRYGSFLNGDLGISIEEKVGRQIFNAYENFDFTDLTSEEVEENKTMLKNILSLQ